MNGFRKCFAFGFGKRLAFTSGNCLASCSGKCFASLSCNALAFYGVRRLATSSHLGEVLVLCFMSADRVRLCLELRGVTRCNVRFFTRVILSAFPYWFNGYVQRKRALTRCKLASCESVKNSA